MASDTPRIQPEMPTMNAYDNNFKLFQVKLVKVSRARCIGCEDTQEILYKSYGIDDVINKLQVTRSMAVLTRNVDLNGQPLFPSHVNEGNCALNQLHGHGH